jgi:hypothetical protein
VRYIMADVQLGAGIDAYRPLADPAAVEAVRRWDVGIRVVNLGQFERQSAGNQAWQVVYVGTTTLIDGMDVELSTAEPSPSPEALPLPLRFHGNGLLATPACQMPAYVTVTILNNQTCKVLVEHPMNCQGDQPRGVSFTFTGALQAGAAGGASQCVLNACRGHDTTGSFAFSPLGIAGTPALTCDDDTLTFEALERYYMPGDPGYTP